MSAGDQASGSRQPRPGLFITFEGGEGAGKTTQATLLAEQLRTRDQRVVLLREPGGTPLGEELRRILLHGNFDLSPPAEVLLFLAARAELVEKVIRPALHDGQTVVCDRFSDSTLAYQGYGRRQDVAGLKTIDRWATGGIEPDLTVLLDLPVDEGRRRKQGDSDNFYRAEDDFHRRVRDGYLYLAALQPSRWLIVDATRAPDVIAAAVWQRVERL